MPFELPNDVIKTDNLDERYDSIKPPMSLGESIKEGYKLGKEETLVKSVFNIKLLKQLEEDYSGYPKLPVEELNALYPHMQRPFTKPMARPIAEWLWGQQKDRREAEIEIERSASISGKKISAGSFVGSLGAFASDPAEFALGTIAGYGVGHVARVAARGGIAGARTAKVGQAIASRPIAAGAIGDLGANISAEIAISDLTRQMGRDYSTQQAFQNAILGTFMATAMRGSIKLGGMGARYVKDKSISFAEELSPQYKMDRALKTLFSEGQIEKAAVTAVAQKMMGRTVNVNNITNPRIRNAFFHEHIPIAGVDELEVRKFYGVKRLGTFEDSRVMVGEDVGNGHYFTDNPNVANNFQTKYEAIDPGGVNAVNLDAPLTPKEKAQLRHLLKDARFKNKRDKVMNRVESYKDFIDEVKTITSPERAMDIINTFHQIKQSEGFDGAFFQSGRTLDSKTEKIQNALMIYDKSKIHVDEKIKPTKQMDYQDHIDDLDSKGIDYDLDEASREYAKIVNETIMPEKRAEIRQANVDIDEQFKDLEKTFKLGSSARKSLDTIKEQVKKETKELEVGKAYSVCIRGK